MGKRISNETIAQIPILYEKLKNKSEVARQLGISTSTVNKYLTVVNAAPPPEESKKKQKRTKITPELIEKINEEYKKCKNMKKVGDMLGIAGSTVKRYLNEENLKLIEQQNDDRDALWYYIYRLFGPAADGKPVSDWNIAQMMKFKSQGIPFKGQLLTLKYFFEIQKNSIEKAKGSIGIVPFKVQEAEQYYKQKAKEKEEMNRIIQEQLERDRIEIKYSPSDYIGKKKKKKPVDLNSI